MFVGSLTRVGLSQAVDLGKLMHSRMIKDMRLLDRKFDPGTKHPSRAEDNTYCRMGLFMQWKPWFSEQFLIGLHSVHLAVNVLHSQFREVDKAFHRVFD